MSEVDTLLALPTDEYGQPIEEVYEVKTFRPNLPTEHYDDAMSLVVMRACSPWCFNEDGSYKTFAPETHEDVFARCGKVVRLRNRDAHEAHCPKCQQPNGGAQ